MTETGEHPPVARRRTVNLSGQTGLTFRASSPLRTGPDVEFDFLPFVKAPVVVADDVGIVNEHVVTIVGAR